MGPEVQHVWDMRLEFMVACRVLLQIHLPIYQGLYKFVYDMGGGMVSPYKGVYHYTQVRVRSPRHGKGLWEGDAVRGCGVADEEVVRLQPQQVVTVCL